MDQYYLRCAHFNQLVKNLEAEDEMDVYLNDESNLLWFNDDFYLTISEVEQLYWMLEICGLIGGKTNELEK